MLGGSACCRRSAFGFAAGFGLPLWILGFLKKRREKRFLNDFPDAVDVIVRGIKAGLPLLDCLKMIAHEAPGAGARASSAPIIETQAIGMPLGEACIKLYERMPLPEANFFGIVISIQQKAGGNLSEALGNLSQGAARPQEDEGEDPGDVDGGEGLRRDHRRAADRGDAARLDHQPEYIELLGPIRSGQHDAGRLRGLDVDRRHGHAQDDQFRLLSATMIQILIDKLHDTRLLAMMFAAMAAVATVLTLAMPLLATDSSTSA